MKKKSFYFEDYADYENNPDKKNTKSIKIPSGRIVFLFFIFFSLISIFSIKIIYLALFPGQNLVFTKVSENFYQERRDIIDRNGTILARNIYVYDAGIRPKLVKDKKKLLFDLKLIFPEIDMKKIEKNLNKKKFFYIKKRLTEDEKTNLWLLGNKAIEFPKKQFRIYPQKNLFSHIVGQIDDDNVGISGIENFFDDKLKEKNLIDSPLKLSVDSNLQHLIREELIIAQSYFKNIGSAALLMDIDNGEVLSLVSLPDYDLNKRVTIDDNIYANKVTLGVYELGSVFKTFTIAAGLENKIIDPNTIFENLENEITCDKYTISEHDKLPTNLNTEQILVRSSNIGAVRIVQKIGIKKYKNFLNSLGILSKISFDLNEVGTPHVFKWGKCKLATSSYGHGITTTPLQLARAYAILGNGGYKINPSILKKTNTFLSVEEKTQIISEETSNTMNSMLRNVVKLNEGTANFADIEGYDVGGKTGTALKYNSKAKLNTFVSIFPSNNPKYVLLVILDEPKPAPSYVYEFPPSEKFPNGYKHKGETRNTSGWNTVVVAGKIIEKIGPILAINNLQASKNF
tara:strand:- start:6778 stop:8490 length:1713 start_codon:yes stop_codon:yes gene_type:complete